jgi:hypothetical protein
MDIKLPLHKDPYAKLGFFNGVMGVLHLVQAGVMLYLSNNFTLPINTNYLAIDLSSFALTSKPEMIYELRIGPVVALFLLISALAHFSLILPGAYDWYIKNLKREINYTRWYEYSLSSSIMIWVIAMLCGVYDLSTLILLFSINACMNLFGLLMEVLNLHTKETNWLPYIFGCFAGIVPWIVVVLFFQGAANNADVKIPEFVYAIVVSLFLFFNIFALNMLLQYKKVGPWKNYLFGERVYIVLSLVAKSLLAWQVFSGTLRPV